MREVEKAGDYSKEVAGGRGERLSYINKCWRPQRIGDEEGRHKRKQEVEK